MVDFFNAQLDYIFFFYGLAFILLGTTCFVIAAGGRQETPWPVLGLFAMLHGIGEWLDLSALLIGDFPAFAMARTGLMAASFVLLMEFGRQGLIRVGLRMPGPWIYALLISLVVLGGFAGGLSVSNVLARYGIGFVGAMVTSLVFARSAKESSSGERQAAVSAAVGFALYGVASGLVVPAAPFWPANVFNSDLFASSFEIPIQLVRGLLACWIAFSIWVIWGHRLMLNASSARYTAYLRKQFAWSLFAMTAILVLGWMLTEFLGGIYKQNVREEARSEIELLASRLAGETVAVESMVKALAGSPLVYPLLVNGTGQDYERAKSVLDLDVQASGATLGYILNTSGALLASSDRWGAASSEPPNYSSSPFFQKALAAEAGYYYSFDAISRGSDFFASYPVRFGGAVIGVAVLKKSLEAFASGLMQFDRPYFFVDPHGVVILTNRPKMQLRTMWPVTGEAQATLAAQFGPMDYRPILERDVIDATWITVDGERSYVQRRYANHSQWSLVMLTPTREIFASRASGIVITLLVTMITLAYLIGRERAVRDQVQFENRLHLQELARDLNLQANTDPLTGSHNRLKFDRALADEMSRSLRYKTPLSLVLFDIDHFKRVNDAYGHQVGDKVLIKLSHFLAGRLRNADLLARWGGEEFVILVPESTGQMAYLLAENLRNATAQVVFDEVGEITCSFGVAQYTNSDTAETFVARADEALYRAKINGRNRVELAFPTGMPKSDVTAVA
jgi:diguanylate cyclase (GGDEF)-like protein